MGVDSTQYCEQTLMFTDIVGYSRLMGRNESLAVEMLGDYRKILLSHIEAQGGQLVEFVGDAIFARFDTATAAVAAAIAIQQHLLAFNEARDKKLPRLQTRIGLNKGEVMLREGAVFGDAVNIAARLEPLAVADGICISQSVYDEVRFSLSSPAKRLGVQPLKNIQQKIRVYFIKPAGIGWRDHLHYFLRGLNRKIVACRYPIAVSVLALIAAGFYFIPRWLVPGYAANYVEIADFKNLMNEKGDADYFSAGITEAVRSQLADMRDVYIVDAKEGIHAPIRLEGSVQKLGDNLRIAYRLFRRKDNVQIAGGKLDGTYQDIFILQDRLVGEIARYLADEFQLQNFRPAPLRLTNDITAYDFYLKGLEYLNKPASKESADEAIKYFNTALVHDAKFSLAFSGICKAYYNLFLVSSSLEWLNLAEMQCKKALDADGFSSRNYVAMGLVYRGFGRYSDAINFIQKALDINAEDVYIGLQLATTYTQNGSFNLAEDIYKKSMEVEEKNWRVYEAYGYFLMNQGRYGEAISNYEWALKITPNNIFVLNNLAAAYINLNDYKSAAKYFELASKVNPNSIVYGNTGGMYFLLREYKKSLSMFEQALALEPSNYEWLIHIADVYSFLPQGEGRAIFFYRKALSYAQADVSERSDFKRPYYFMARAFAALGDIAEAKKTLGMVVQTNEMDVDYLYSCLRVAIVDKDDESVIRCTKQLLKNGYSMDLILSDPTLSWIKDKRFYGVFN